MVKIRVTKEFDFEMAHALWNYDGACKNIHGHSYKLFVTLLGIPNAKKGHPKFGMVIDFSELKRLVNHSIIDHLDHSLVVYREAEGQSLDAIASMYDKIHVFDFQPTCENLVHYIAETLQPLMPENTTLYSLKLLETATSYAEWFAGDN